MDTTTVNAEVRNDFGKGATRKLRAASRVPAIIYREGQAPRHVSVNARELRLMYEKTGNPTMVLAIDTGEDTITAVLKDAQKHPVSRALLHVDFYQVKEGVNVTVDVPITTSGKSKGAVQGGKLRMLRYTVGVTCAPENIPAAIDVNLAPLDIGDFLRASEINAPAGCEVTFDHDYNILTIVGKSKAAVAEEAAEACTHEGGRLLVRHDGVEARCLAHDVLLQPRHDRRPAGLLNVVQQQQRGRLGVMLRVQGAVVGTAVQPLLEPPLTACPRMAS